MEKTMQNLAKAFIGESQARNRYTFYAKIAQKEGYEQIAEIFLKTAENEREHAKWLYRLLSQLEEKKGEKVALKVEAEVPLKLGSTLENLEAAIAGETYEHSQMYPTFAQVAEEEGLPEIAQRLRAIARAEEHHAQRYAKILVELKNDSYFQKQEKVYWVCRKCGYIHEGTTPPEECPSCGHPRSYFELEADKF